MAPFLLIHCIHDIMDWDAGVLMWIRDNLSCGFLDAVMPVISKICTADIIWFIAALLMIRDRRTRKAGTVLLLALVISILIANIILKPAVGRIRPYDALDVPIIVSPSSEYSFPSGHTGSSAAASAAMLRELPLKIGIPAVILASLIAFSRMYLGVHYPTDIIGGALSGVLISYVSNWIVDLLYKRFGTEKQAL